MKNKYARTLAAFLAANLFLLAPGFEAHSAFAATLTQSKGGAHIQLKGTVDRADGARVDALDAIEDVPTALDFQSEMLPAGIDVQLPEHAADGENRADLARTAEKSPTFANVQAAGREIARGGDGFSNLRRLFERNEAAGTAIVLDQVPSAQRIQADLPAAIQLKASGRSRAGTILGGLGVLAASAGAAAAQTTHGPGGTAAWHDYLPFLPMLLAVAIIFAPTVFASLRRSARDGLHSIVETKSAPEPGKYSQARVVDAGNHWIVYTAGQTGNDPKLPDQGVVEGGIKAQTRQALENLRAILKEKGGDIGDVVDVTVFMKDMAANNAGFEEAYGEFFKGHAYPARSKVEVSEIPLPSEPTIVMIKMVAHIPKTRAAVPADDSWPHTFAALAIVAAGAAALAFWPSAAFAMGQPWAAAMETAQNSVAAFVVGAAGSFALTALAAMLTARRTKKNVPPAAVDWAGAFIQASGLGLAVTVSLSMTGAVFALLGLALAYSSGRKAKLSGIELINRLLFAATINYLAGVIAYALFMPFIDAAWIYLYLLR